MSRERKSIEMPSRPPLKFLTLPMVPPRWRGLAETARPWNVNGKAIEKPFRPPMASISHLMDMHPQRGSATLKRTHHLWLNFPFRSEKNRQCLELVR